MKVIKSSRKDNVYSLEVEESFDRLQREMDVVFQQLVKRVRIPGFRKGKITRSLYEKNFGRNDLIRESVLNVIDEAYRLAIEELKLEPVDMPKELEICEYKDNEPISFRCNVTVKPEVKLGKYKGLKATRKTTEVKEADIAAQITELQSRYADFQIQPDQPSASGDIVKLNLTAQTDGEPLKELCRSGMAFQVGSQMFGEAFDVGLEGVRQGEHRSCDVTFPSDSPYTSAAGKTVHFEFDVEEVRKKQLPDLTDEFVMKATQLPTADALKADIRSRLETQAKESGERELNDRLIDQLIEASKVELPDAMVEREIDRRIRDFDQQLSQSGFNLDRYLELTKKTLESMRADFRDQARKYVLTSLILEAVAQAEKLAATEEMLDTEIQQFGMPDVQSLSELRVKNPAFDETGLKRFITEREALRFVASHAKITDN